MIFRTLKEIKKYLKSNPDIKELPLMQFLCLFTTSCNLASQKDNKPLYGATWMSPQSYIFRFGYQFPKSTSEFDFKSGKALTKQGMSIEWLRDDDDDKPKFLKQKDLSNGEGPGCFYSDDMDLIKNVSQDIDKLGKFETKKELNLALDNIIKKHSETDENHQK